MIFLLLSINTCFLIVVFKGHVFQISSLLKEEGKNNQLTLMLYKKNRSIESSQYFNNLVIFVFVIFF